MNVTAVGGTLGSFLTIWPSDVAPRPLASNLNWVPGSPPTPNKVDVKVSVADGKINLFNLAGIVFVLADVVGYYADHNFDDRYYTKAEVYTKGEVDREVRDDRHVDAEHSRIHCRQRHRGLDESMRAPGRRSVHGAGGCSAADRGRYHEDPWVPHRQQRDPDGTSGVRRDADVNAALCDCHHSRHSRVSITLVASRDARSGQRRSTISSSQYIGRLAALGSPSVRAEIDYTIRRAKASWALTPTSDDPAGVPSGSD